MTFPDGTIKEGLFEDNVFVGSTNVQNQVTTVPVIEKEQSSNTFEVQRSSLLSKPPRSQSRGTVNSIIK
jgi:hypothetical protein